MRLQHNRRISKKNTSGKMYRCRSENCRPQPANLREEIISVLVPASIPEDNHHNALALQRKNTKREVSLLSSRHGDWWLGSHSCCQIIAIGIFTAFEYLI